MRNVANIEFVDCATLNQAERKFGSHLDHPGLVHNVCRKRQEKMVGFRLYAPLFLFGSTDAFSPVVKNIQAFSRTNVRSRRRSTSLPNDDMLLEAIDPVTPIQILDTSLQFETLSGNNAILNEQAFTVDQGKEMFLASIATTSPEAVAESMDVASPFNSSGLVSSGTAEETDGGFTMEEFSLEEPQFSLDVMGDIQSESNNALTDDERSTVFSVLAASQQAVEAAEASMPQNLVDQLELTSPFASNETTTMSETLGVTSLPEIMPASDIVGEPATNAPKMEVPSVSRILKFAVPAVGVWLCSPLLSLIDTSAVGLLSGTTQQAALNPAVAVTDYAALLIVSLFSFWCAVLRHEIRLTEHCFVGFHVHRNNKPCSIRTRV